MHWALTSLLLPPFLLVLAGGAAGLLAWRGWRAGGLVAALAALAQLLLATPFASDALTDPLERITRGAPASPGAVVVLGATATRDGEGYAVGALTLERLRAGAALARRTGLPLLVTAGPVAPDGPPLAELMARSLAEDFGAAPRWIEPVARDTHENAALAVAMLRAEAIGGAFLVTHGWHMPRAQEAFARLDFPTAAAPVHAPTPAAGGLPADWVPDPAHLALSWLALREWAGRLIYAIRD